MSNKPIFVDETIAIHAEIVEDNVFIHTYVYKFSPSLMKKYKAIFKTIREEFMNNGVGCVFACTPNPKFAKLMDSSCKCLDVIEAGGRRYEVLVWE